MIKFFRNTLSGPLYIVVALLSLIFIMAIIGFIMERKKQEKEEKGRIAYVNNSVPEPLESVEVKAEETPIPVVEQSNLDNNVDETVPQQPEANDGLPAEAPVVVFDDPDKKE